MHQLKRHRKSNVRNAARATLAMGLVMLATSGIRASDGGSGGGGGGTSGGGGGGVASLKTVLIPGPPDLTTYVRDQQALVTLGKALFWDMQTGNDGKQACATCHFHAGADHRRENQLNPNGGPLTANYMLQSLDFPFHTRHVAGSSGVMDRTFTDVVPGNSVDDGYSVLDPVYNVNGVGVRRVTGRNTPSVINAVFNVRNFWDGRAKDTFSIFTPFGNSDPNGNIVVEVNGKLQQIKVHIQNSSLSSQSVGPPNNPTEMSSAGRNWEKLGKKMLSLMPLAKQMVDPTDSILGSLAKSGGPGLKSGVTYSSLVQAAFVPKYWNSNRLADASSADLNLIGPPKNTSQYSQMEYNFAMFWGMAIQAYESTLVSNDSPVDRYAEGNRTALTALEQQGMNIFNGKGNCQSCHSGAETTSATFTALAQFGPSRNVGGSGLSDTGFARIGVRPIAEDGGIAGNDGFGNPLSNVKALFPNETGFLGAVKVPSLRNTEFTGPYFHNGGMATLEQVVDFYSRGGDFPTDGTTHSAISPKGFSASEQAALVAFLKALSDDRVRYQRAPFDHPQLCVANGAMTPIQLTTNGGTRFTNEAKDNFVEIPAVGAAGGAPLQTFAELIGAAPASGPRANDLTKSCNIQ